MDDNTQTANSGNDKLSFRLKLLDTIRGITLISMILYHGVWDMVYIFEKRWNWYRGTGAYIWQQSICWVFILLSGFCWSFGKKRIKNGVVVFGSGALVTFVTLVVMPENRVVFGVLTLLGSCMLLMSLLECLFKKMPAELGLLVAGLSFFLTRNVNQGYLGFEKWNFIKLPDVLYKNLLGTYFGFPTPDFFSTDYFSLFPWLFLFVCGYFLHRLCDEKKWFGKKIFQVNYKPLSFIGRHSLLIYLVHQPVLYGICYVVSGIWQ